VKGNALSAVRSVVNLDRGDRSGGMVLQVLEGHNAALRLDHCMARTDVSRGIERRRDAGGKGEVVWKMRRRRRAKDRRKKERRGKSKQENARSTIASATLPS
jgi:hypothetical protein